MVIRTKHIQKMTGLYLAVDGIQDALTFLPSPGLDTSDLEAQLTDIYKAINQLIDDEEAVHIAKQSQVRTS